MQLIEALEALVVDKLGFLYCVGGLDDSAVTGEPFLYLDCMILKSSPIAALSNLKPHLVWDTSLSKSENATLTKADFISFLAPDM
ncbi:MAG: hypothetical protein DUD39_16205 [Coriobacteriaceae bacterium]|nr:MAG: hypothetical protein DUD39_16205 [Coriobacteriaceae bacterium]